MIKLLLSLCMALLCLNSCASSSKRKRGSLADMRMEERFSRGLKAMKEGHSSNNLGFRSQYDKAATATLSEGRRGSAGWFSRQKYGAQDFNGVKAFQAKEYKTQVFSGADDKNWMAKQALSERDKVPAFTDDAFDTKKSPFANDSAREGKMTARESDDVFKTKLNREAAKSQKANRGPIIIELPEQSKDPAYTEDQVRKLLGRD